MFFRPSKLVKALGLPLICVAMFSIAGGHWAVLQTVAWSQMLWSYSKSTGSLVEGAEKTFSGKYPCSMCKTVEAGRKAEEKLPATVKLDKKAEVFLSAFGEGIHTPPYRKFRYNLAPDALLVPRNNAPPTPVPIFTVA